MLRILRSKGCNIYTSLETKGYSCTETLAGFDRFLKFNTQWGKFEVKVSGNENDITGYGAHVTMCLFNSETWERPIYRVPSLIGDFSTNSKDALGLFTEYESALVFKEDKQYRFSFNKVIDWKNDSKEYIFEEVVSRLEKVEEWLKK